MSHTIDPVLCKANAAFAPSPTTRLRDCTGEVSIVVLTDDDDGALAFLLCEKDGLAWVGTVSGDEWINEESFFGIRAGIDAILTNSVRGSASA